MLNLLVWYEIYLYAVLVVTILLRYRLCCDLARLGIEFPSRWPKLMKVIFGHSRPLMSISVLLPTGVALAMAVGHSVLNRVYWFHADLSLITIAKYPPITLLIAGLGGLMIYMDVQTLKKKVQLDLSDLKSTLDRGELALAKPVDWTVRLVTFGAVSTSRMVEEQVTQTIEYECEEIDRMMRGWFKRTIVRLVFGMTCWFTWTYLYVAGSALEQAAIF